MRDKFVEKVVDKIWEVIGDQFWFTCRVKSDEQGVSMEVIINNIKAQIIKVLVNSKVVQKKKLDRE